MSECGCNHNQTHQAVFDFIKSKGLKDTAFLKGSQTLGFGLFVIPAPDLGILETKTLVVSELSYNECEKRAANCIVFQWIPKGIEIEEGGKKYTLSSTEELSDYLTNMACDDCKGGCKMGCNCSKSGQVNCASNFAIA